MSKNKLTIKRTTDNRYQNVEPGAKVPLKHTAPYFPTIDIKFNSISLKAIKQT